jgi:hypothetical protein
VAYEYTSNFSEAKVCLEKGYQLSGRDRYLNEIKRCQQLERDKQRLDEQRQGSSDTQEGKI